MKITIIGAGNVGYHLAMRLYEARGETDNEIVQIFSRKQSRFVNYPKALQKLACTDILSINKDSHLYIIAVKDDAIKEVSNALVPLPAGAMIVHTSGATSSSVLEAHPDFGIFYPLQTFNVHKQIEWEKLPFCVYGNSRKTEEQLFQLALQLSKSGNVHRINDEQRQWLHVAAVFANNFTNYLLGISENILHQQHLPFDLLKPLIEETFKKIQDQSPGDCQTGPAKRKDMDTIHRHLQLLKNYKTYRNLYAILSEGLLNKY